MTVSVEEVSSSVVREYLSRKGLKKTIACMDEEHPRTEASINNRSHLRQILNLEALYRKNKAQKSPLKTLLEIIVKHRVESKTPSTGSDPPASSTISRMSNSTDVTPTPINNPHAGDNTEALVICDHVKLRSERREICPETDRLSSQSQTGFWDCESEEQKQQPATLQDNESLIRRGTEKNISITGSTQRSQANRIRRGIIAGPIASTSQESNKKRQNRRLEGHQPLLRREEEHKQTEAGLLLTGLQQKSPKSSSGVCVGGQRELWSTPERLQRENSLENVQKDILQTTKAKLLSRPSEAGLDVSEMVLDDVDEDELRELSKVSFQRTVSEHSCGGRPMDQRTATELKAVLTGSSLNSFRVEWINQGFTFSETHDVRYGIVQKKGGPCGVLATVQAFVLIKLLFENMESSNTDLQKLRPSNATRRKCLALAVAEILWRAGEEKQATLAINSERNHFTSTGLYKCEGVLEKVTCFTVDKLKDLQLLLEQHIDQFETGRLGCILLTISAILSRSIEKVRDDMDVPTNTLIGAHGYCTQELVNLLLCGKAVSNVFDNDMELDSGNGNMTLLKGVKGHCDIGLLSLFEHYNICKVGAYMKTPRYPIWVVCSESHFSVLFSLQREVLTSQDQDLEFDLYYYDGLANQQEEIRLTVSVGKSALSFQDADADLIPPLELCIRTRWKDAFVSWNDTEPIL